MLEISTQRLLIVDDDAPIRSLMRRLALRAGFEADTAKDGSEAWAKLKTNTYDIVIVDLMMPHVTGFELVELINTLHPRPTVIVATAMLNGDVSRIDDSMIRRVIRKPFDIDAVVKALVDTANEIAAGRAIGTLPSAIQEIIPGDAQSHAQAAAEHAAAAAAYAAAAADHAAAAAEEAIQASEESPTAPKQTEPARIEGEKSRS